MQNGDCLGSGERSRPRSRAKCDDALSAQFYSGVCQMKLNQLDAAAATLGQVAGKGDSPQQEAALYYLAQIASAARRFRRGAVRIWKRSFRCTENLSSVQRRELNKTLCAFPWKQVISSD